MSEHILNLITGYFSQAMKFPIINYQNIITLHIQTNKPPRYLNMQG